MKLCAIRPPCHMIYNSVLYAGPPCAAQVLLRCVQRSIPRKWEELQGLVHDVKKEEEKNNIRALLAVRYDRPSSWRWIGTVDRRPGRCGDINETGRWWKRFPSIVIFDPFFFSTVFEFFFFPLFSCVKVIQFSGLLKSMKCNHPEINIPSRK